MSVFACKRIAAIALASALIAPASAQSSQPASSHDQLIANLRSHVKHVFVIVQENHSFDNYFGTYPGAENLASALAQQHGFAQADPIGQTVVTPFRITDPDTESASQNRLVVYQKFDGGAMDKFVAVQEALSLKKFADPAKARAVGLLTMAHYDCDTIPFLWKYAHTFALFDHIFQAMTGPSTASNVEFIAAQAGQSQGARTPAALASPGDTGAGVPIVNDLDPAYGPYPDTPDGAQIPQRYATIMHALAGSDDSKATAETAGIAGDLAWIAASGRAPIPWGWYQEGYVSPSSALPGYESHHNAPQYFASLRNNDVYWKNVHDAKALLTSLHDGTLPGSGVFYLKGASQTEFPWRPANRDPVVQAHWRGDDDHPGYGDSDHQVAESFVATFVNAIARSKYWNDSAIILTWDDAGGYYDHVPPPHFEACPDGKPCGDGQRLPFILISPYARSGAIVKDPGDSVSVVKFVETLFGIPPLASLPDEKPYLPEGPRDANPLLTNLIGAFDPARLDGSSAPIPASAAEIPDAIVNAEPPAMNCASLGITPVTLPNAPSTPPPAWKARVH